MIEWSKAWCPICGNLYEYYEKGYKPPTCSNYDCIHKWVHQAREKIDKEIKLASEGN